MEAVKIYIGQGKVRSGEMAIVYYYGDYTVLYEGLFLETGLIELEKIIQVNLGSRVLLSCVPKIFNENWKYLTTVKFEREEL